MQTYFHPEISVLSEAELGTVFLTLALPSVHLHHNSVTVNSI